MSDRVALPGCLSFSTLTSPRVRQRSTVITVYARKAERRLRFWCVMSGSDAAHLFAPHKPPWQTWEEFRPVPHLIAAMPSAPLHAAVCLTGAVRSLASTAFPLQRAILDAWDADLFVVLHTDGSHGSERHGWVNGSSTGTSSTGTPASAEDAHRVLGTLRPKAGWLDDFGGRRKYGVSSNMPSQPPKQ